MDEQPAGDVAEDARVVGFVQEVVVVAGEEDEGLVAAGGAVVEALAAGGRGDAVGVAVHEEERDGELLRVLLDAVDRVDQGGGGARGDLFGVDERVAAADGGDDGGVA